MFRYPLIPQAVRRAPGLAHGFRVTASKWLILVRLLLGEIPDRTEFAQPGLSAALHPYFELTQSVKAGDTLAFKTVREGGREGGEKGLWGVSVWVGRLGG